MKVLFCVIKLKLLSEFIITLTVYEQL